MYTLENLMFYMYKDIDNIIVCNKKKMGGEKST